MPFSFHFPTLYIYFASMPQKKKKKKIDDMFICYQSTAYYMSVMTIWEPYFVIRPKICDAVMLDVI